MLRPYNPVQPSNQSSVHERPQQLPALPVQPLRRSQVIQIPRQVADEQPAMWQRAGPIIEPRLERARTLLRLHAPASDLDLLLDLEHLRDLEDEPRDRERPLQGGAGALVEIRRIANKGELLLIRISQRQMPRRLGPREATAYRYRPLLLPPHRPQRAVGPPLEAQRLPPSGGGRFAQGQRHGTSFLLELQLQLVQMPVLPFRFRQQFGVRAVLDQPAVLDHEQPRRLAERREPVRDR